ncbi:MAG: hypothetical protein ACPGVB_11390 [Chitinophagales bacterium]
MSGCDVYQFQSIDRPLTEKERKEIGSWSSRSYPTATSATFIYHYGSFRQNLEDALAGYFDALLHFSSWGTKRLLFRVPKNLIDIKALRLYQIDANYDYECGFSILPKKEYFLLDFTWSEEEGSWIEEEEYQVGDLIALRNDIIQGDYRSLYLFWLKLAASKKELGEEDYDNPDDYDEDEVDTVPPPIPPNLNKLSGALSAFIELFEINKDLIAAAKQASKEVKAPEMDYEKLVKQLSEKERIDFLIRLAKGEVRVDLQLQKRLQDLYKSTSKTTSKPSKQFSIQELKEQQKVEKKKRKETEAQAAKEAHRQKMLTLSREVKAHWGTVSYNLDRKTGKAYDIATETLKDLQDLAIFQDKVEEFKEKMAEIREEYGRSKVLLVRFMKAGLF